MKKLINHLPVLLSEYQIEIDWDSEEGTANGHIADLIAGDWACSFDYVIFATRKLTPAIFDSPAEANDHHYTTALMNLKVYLNDKEIDSRYLDAKDLYKLEDTIIKNLNIK